MAKEHRDWHRLFGLILTDFFSGSPFKVELELDLSLKQQWLDVVILRREDRLCSLRLPDGLDNLRKYNLDHVQVLPGGADGLGIERTDRTLRQLSQAGQSVDG